MVREIKTVRDAAQEWVREMNAYPYDMIAKLMANDPDEWHEVTKPTRCDRVYAFGIGEGEITGVDKMDDKTVYTIELDSGDLVALEDFEFEVEYDDILPMWGTLWSFGDSCDDWWLEEDNGIELMSRCGFRIYQSDDFGYFFGIDGAGYDFYESHWIPLYKARGLKWHDVEETV